MMPEVVNEAAEGSGVGVEGSGEGEVAEGITDDIIVGDGEDDDTVVRDGEAPAPLQPATRHKAATMTAMPLMRPSRDRV